MTLKRNHQSIFKTLWIGAKEFFNFATMLAFTVLSLTTLGFVAHLIWYFIRFGWRLV